MNLTKTKNSIVSSGTRFMALFVPLPVKYAYFPAVGFLNGPSANSEKVGMYGCLVVGTIFPAIGFDKSMSFKGDFDEKSG